jgi:small subunit ribosomal protein S6
MAALTAKPANLVREYETIYILRGDADTETAERVSNRVAEVMGRENGKLIKVENWGRRRLAYDIAKQKRGVYTYLKFLGSGALVNELERNLRLLDAVMRYQTVQLRNNVVAETVEVNPEETKFEAPPALTDEDKDESRERQLGFLEQPDEHRRHRRDDGAEEDLEGIDEEETMNPDIAGIAEGEEK